MQAEQANVHLRLTIDVHYSLNGECNSTMAALLTRFGEQAVNDGTLTGSTRAILERHTVSTQVVPVLMSAEAVADAWAGR